MKLAHHIRISVFSKEDEDAEAIKTALISLINLDLEKEKLSLQERNAKGFEQKKIKVFEITLAKERHTAAFIGYLTSHLSAEQKELLQRQTESRIDHDLNFYLRLDKAKLLQGQYWITDEGDCFHIKVSLAVFPKKPEKAVELVKEIFK